MSAPGTGENRTGYEAYDGFVRNELDAQAERKRSFEQGGLAVITTSGTLVTLLFALAALSTKEKEVFALPGAARGWLLLALGCFLVAAVAAIVTSLPLKYEVVVVKDIRGRLKEEPVRAADQATKDIALTRLKALADAKRKNGWKGAALFVAITFEVLAVACVGGAVFNIL